jgi:hypothetical protein
MALAALHWAEAGALLCECLAARLAAGCPAARAAPAAEGPPGRPRGWPAAAAGAGAPGCEGRAYAPKSEPGPPPAGGGGVAHAKRRRGAGADEGQEPPGKRLAAGAERGPPGAAASGGGRQERGCGDAAACGGVGGGLDGADGWLGGAPGGPHSQAPAASGATKAMPMQPPGFAHALQAAWSALVSGLAGSGPCAGSPAGGPPPDQAARPEERAPVWLPGDVCCLGRRAGFLSPPPAEGAPGAQPARASPLSTPTQQARVLACRLASLSSGPHRPATHGSSCSYVSTLWTAAVLMAVSGVTLVASLRRA